MKKYVLIIVTLICIISLLGCTNKNDTKKETIENEKDIYIKYVKKLKKIKKSSEDLPFSIEVKYEKMSDEVRYQVIIDEPKEEIKDIQAVAIHNKQTDDVFPSVGIFDKKVNLIKDKKPSGVILVGYFPYKGDMDKLDVEVKILISYKINNEKITSYYVTKK